MAANKINIIAGLYKITNFETITVDNTVKTLTESLYLSGLDYAKRILITFEDAQSRWKANGDSPSSTEGHIQNPMDALVLLGSDNIKNFKITRKGSANAKIMVSYEF